MTIGGSNCFLMIHPYQLNVHHGAFCWLESLGVDFYGWHLSCLGATNRWSCLFVFIAFLLLGRCKEVLPNRACQDTVFCVNGQHGMVSFLRKLTTDIAWWCLFCSKCFTFAMVVLFATSLAPSQYKGLSRYGCFHYKDKMVMKPSYLPALVRQHLYIGMGPWYFHPKWNPAVY